MKKQEKENILIHESLFVTTPDKFDVDSRINTSFGLRPLEYAHDEEVVPKIGSLEFVRQASWAVGAIKLFNENEDVRTIARTPTILANAIEALGCKLEFRYDRDLFEKKHRRGILAFKRPNSTNLWKFSDLKKKTSYVQNTYRQNVVSALYDLGLCECSTRFNQMQLTDIGDTLADNFLKKQNNDLNKILSHWVCKKSEQKNKNYTELLSPDYCSSEEKNILKQCLNTFDNESPDPQKRIRLIKLMNSITTKEKSWNELRIRLKNEGPSGERHMHQIENAIRFEKIKNHARALYNECANYIFKCNSDSCSFSILCNVENIVKVYWNLKNSIETYHKSARCELPVVGRNNLLLNSAYKNIENTLQYLVEHEGRALICKDNDIAKGLLLKENGFKPIDDGNRSWGHPKLNQLYNLWRECNE